MHTVFYVNRRTDDRDTYSGAHIARLKAKWHSFDCDNVTLFQLTCESNPGMIFHLKSSVYQKAGGFIHINRKRAQRRPLNYEGSVEKSLLDILSTYGT